MLYFSNQELADSYHVSARTVRNWIDAAREGKISLTLHTKGERTFIANTSKNISTLEKLADKGKKYRPHRAHRSVSPSELFYELYSDDHIYDIVSNLEINREIPIQYQYFGAGAENWEEYTERLANEENLNSLQSTVLLLKNNQSYIDLLLRNYNQVNIIDVGVGNGYAIRDFLNHFIELGKLGRYIAIDISSEMLDIAEKNIKQWFGNKVIFERHTLDINHDSFGNLLVAEYIKTNAIETSNLVLFLGGTLSNFRKPQVVLNSIHQSMGVNDYLLHSQKLDTQKTRQYFDFKPSEASPSSLPPLYRYVIDLLNIDESMYDVEMGYDPEQDERYYRIVFTVAVSIQFKFKNGLRNLSFNKGDKVLVWRARQLDSVEVASQLMKNDFRPLQISQTPTQEYVLTVSRIKRD